MARSTIVDLVSFGEREKIVIDTRRRPLVGIQPVTFDAVGRKADLSMVGFGGGHVIRAVTVDALHAQRFKLQLRSRGVASGAIGSAVRTQKRKAA